MTQVELKQLGLAALITTSSLAAVYAWWVNVQQKKERRLLRTTKEPSTHTTASIKRRQNRILSKRIPKQNLQEKKEVLEEYESDEEHYKINFSSENESAQGDGQKNLKLYEYYGSGSDSCEASGDYGGYSSSYRTEGDENTNSESKENNKQAKKRLSNWNSRFRSCIKRLQRLEPTAQLTDRIEINLQLMHLAQDFIYAATAYGKIIISEYYLPYHSKTIKPCALGGLMGGQKYVVHNILFKFAVDNRGLFGSDHAAAKVAGNELRGLISYYNCHIDDLNVPLMALVDYRGFRLIAMSILPVGKDTIIYGSCDAGRNIHATNKRLNELMCKAAEVQNLKPHYCRVAKSPTEAQKKKEQPTEETKIIFQQPLQIDSHGFASSSLYSAPKDQEINCNYEPILAQNGSKISHNPYESSLGSSDDEIQDRVELLYSPADLEGHMGRDGRFYLLDFSRVLPPETPHKMFKNAHLSRLLRPEFVREHSKPLCPDAFSGFIKNTQGEQEHNKDIEEACEILENVHIPKFAKDLDRLMEESKEQGSLQKFRVTETAHSYGVNCRHLGKLRKYLKDTNFKNMILLEVLARVIKNNIRWKLREKMKQIALPLEEPYRKLVIDYFNLVFGNSKNSDEHWDKWLKKDIQINFPDTLTAEEMDVEFHLKLRNKKRQIDTRFLYDLFTHVTKMLGMLFSFTPARERNFLNPEPFDDTDLEQIGERVKHMNIIAHARGYFYHVKGLANRVEDPLTAQKFYEIAIEKYNEALNSDPNNKEILLSMALTWMLMIEEGYKHVPNAKFRPEDPKVQKAEEYSLRAILAEPKYDSFSLFRYAQFLEKCGKIGSAEDYYLMALEADPNNAGSLHCYGSLLSERGEHEEAEEFFKRASLNTIGLKQWPQWYH